MTLHHVGGVGVLLRLWLDYGGVKAPRHQGPAGLYPRGVLAIFSYLLHLPPLCRRRCVPDGGVGAVPWSCTGGPPRRVSGSVFFIVCRVALWVVCALPCVPV